MKDALLIFTILGGFCLSIWSATYGYAAGIIAGTDRGKAMVYEAIMGGAVYNLGALREPPALPNGNSNNLARPSRDKSAPIRNNPVNHSQ